MTALAKTAGGSGALYTSASTIPTNATWYEDIFFRDESGNPYDLTGNEFKLTLRSDESSETAELTLSTADGLSIETDSGSSVDCLLRINTAPAALQPGDYVA